MGPDFNLKQVNKVCSYCDGTGYMFMKTLSEILDRSNTYSQRLKCSHCEGKGYITKWIEKEETDGN